MDVARERVAAARRAGLVVQHERTEGAARVDAAHAEGFGRIAGAGVVVAANESELEGAGADAPLAGLLQRARRAPVLRMQEVAEEHHLLRARARDGPIEAREILARGARGQRNARLAESRGLAEVEVGDEEGTRARPERGLFR